MVDAWATVDDVDLYTDEIVDEKTLFRAQKIVELFAGCTFSATDNISQTNLRHLRAAVASQAGWMPSRPDLFSHQDIDTASGDGASHTPGTVNAQLLAPFAARHLARLTWRNKPLRVRRRYAQSDYYNDRGPRDSAVADDNAPWTPM
jgi:hypothetical protein